MMAFIAIIVMHLNRREGNLSVTVEMYEYMPFERLQTINNITIMGQS